MKPGKPRRNGSAQRFSPSAKAEFLAPQNCFPPSSFAGASARSFLAGAGPACPTSFEPHPRDRRHEPKARGDGKRNEAMNTIAEFTIIGRVGEIRQVGTTLRVNIASSYSRKDNRGEWVERTRWNEVTVFGESTRGYVKRNIVKGDLVFTSGSMGQTKWEKDGETLYGVTLAGERIERLSKGPNHHDNSPDEPQEKRPGRGDDSDDIPF
jgi:single-strand DNA-binding protein